MKSFGWSQQIIFKNMTKNNLYGAPVFLGIGNIALLPKNMKDENSFIFIQGSTPQNLISEAASLPAWPLIHVFYHMQNYGPNPGRYWNIFSMCTLLPLLELLLCSHMRIAVTGSC